MRDNTEARACWISALSRAVGGGGTKSSGDERDAAAREDDREAEAPDSGTLSLPPLPLLLLLSADDILRDRRRDELGLVPAYDEYEGRVTARRLKSRAVEEAKERVERGWSSSEAK